MESDKRRLTTIMKILRGLANGQVLQRLGKDGASCQITGSCSGGGSVYATIAGPRGIVKGWKRRHAGEVSGQTFTAELIGIPAGGPYRLELQCGSKKAVRSFFVGDVWLLAGQSNMQGTGDMTGAAKPHPLIRAFSMRHAWRLAEDPLHILAESADACHNDGFQCSQAQCEIQRSVEKKGVGIGVFFAQEMLKNSGVPQGLIPTAHGATTLAQWSPKAKALFYESMLRTVRATGQPVAGVLWYQGESDAKAETAPRYTHGMKELVSALRRDLRQPRLPWIVAQLARSFEAERDGAAWNDIQEQQRLLPDQIDCLETVATVDLPLDDAVHLGAVAFPRLAMRMAESAKHLVFQQAAKRQPRLCSVVSPSLPVDAKGCTYARPFVEVVFDHVVGGLQAPGEPSGFTLLDVSGAALQRIYKTTLHGNRVRLHADWAALREVNPKLVYGHGATPLCNITDARGCAVPVFGPVPVFKPTAFLPFVTEWNATGIVTSCKPLKEIDWRDIAVLASTRKQYPDGFINEHLSWRGKQGQQYFNAWVDLKH